MSYDDVYVHKLMIQDRVRTSGYKKAIEQVVKPGMTVIDFGCGSGVLSVFAAKAGAKRVIAIDKSQFIIAAKMVAKANGVDDVVEFYHCEPQALDCNFKADVIISEWMGHFVYFEWMLEPLLFLRDNFLSNEGVMLPMGINFFASFVTDKSLFDNIKYLENQPYDVNFEPIASWPAYNVYLERFDPSQLSKQTLKIGGLDMSRCQEEKAVMQGSVEILFDMTVYGLAGWFETVLCNQNGFGTGPFDPKTHWKQAFFPFECPFFLKRGDKAVIDIFAKPDNNKTGTFWSWAMKTQNYEQKMENFVHKAWLARSLPQGRI